MTPRQPQALRDPRASANRGPALTAITPSNAWLTAQALHAKALLPANSTPEAFDAKASAYWSGGQVEQTFTSANLAYLHMAQAEEHHLALMGLLAAQRSDTAALARQVQSTHATLHAIGKLIQRAAAKGVAVQEEAVELLGALADAWDAREGGPALHADDKAPDHGFGADDGEELVDLDAAPAGPTAPGIVAAPSGRAARYSASAPGEEEEELVEVDENGNPVEAR
jgi:hypothetical protein